MEKRKASKTFLDPVAAVVASVVLVVVVDAVVVVVGPVVVDVVTNQSSMDCSSTSRKLENTFCHPHPGVSRQFVCVGEQFSVSCSMVTLTFETKLSTAGANDDRSLLTPINPPMSHIPEPAV